MGLQVAAAGKIINEFTGLAFAGGEFETDNPAIRFVSAEAWTRDAQGAHITFATAPVGTSSPVEGMRLTSEGILLVGTDTASGSAKLQVSGAINVSGITYAGTLALSATGANVITLATNGTERLRVTSTGKIGAAGTNSPVQPLDFGIGAANEKIIIGTYTNGVGWSGIGMDATSNGIRVAGGYTSPTDPLLDVGYYSYDTSHTWTNRLRVLNNGNTLFGGTTNGDYRLDVQSSGSSGTLRVYDQTATTGSTSLVFRAGAGQSTNAILNITANNGTTSVLKVLETKIAFFNATPVVKAAAPTAANNSALNTGDATSDTVIGNMRTRIGEVITALQAYGLLT